MPTSFMQSPQLFFTSESVTEGHPDKLCDQISDAILDAFLAQDPRARVACETAATTGLVLVMGEVTTEAYVEIQEIVRQTIREIGYTGIGSGFDADTCGVIVSLHGQSPDIAMGVDQGPRGQARPDDRGRGRGDRRGRPGHDDRVRLQRDARAICR